MTEKKSAKSTRRHAAIMFTDIVGYTALMGSDEDLAFEVLKKNRALHNEQIRKFGGTLIKEMGDGMLVSFPLASDAVRCAQWILLESEKQNISLRIGIHQGELIFENSDVLGDGVNVASRLQEITEPGCIAVSEPVYRDVKNKAGIHVRFLGEENFKNVTDPLKVYDVKSEVDQELWEGEKDGDSKAANNSFITGNKLVKFSIIIGLIVVIALLLFWQFEPVKKDSIVENAEIEKSIAVLPFKNDSPDQENEYFCNGMMEAILNHLANIKDLKVLSRTDVEIYRNSSKSREEIARELGVVNILEGSVYKVGNNFRLSVQLINAENGYHLWSDAIEGEYTEEIFTIQSRIAEQVASAMHAVISPTEQDEINTHPTSNITAYDYGLRGQEMIRNYWRSFNRKYLKSALEMYDKALKVDPEFSNAIYLKAQIYFAQRKYDSTLLLAKRNLQLDPKNGSAYYLLGECYRAKGDMESAIKYLSKAVELKPESGWPNLALGSAHFSQKNGAAKGAKYLQNALDNMERSMAPELFLHIGLNFFNIGDFERAEKYISDALDLQVGCIGIQRYSMVLLAQGKTEESIACLASVKEENSCGKLYWQGMLYVNLFDQNFEEAELNYKMLLEAGGVPDVRDSIFIGSVYAYSGKVEESTAIYKRLDESYPYSRSIDNPPHVNLGFMVYSLARNDKNMAMKYLRILDSRGFIMGINYLIENNPLFTDLREEPECQEILRNARESKIKERAIIQEMSDRGEISL